jgi:hypothetical protein
VSKLDERSLVGGVAPFEDDDEAMPRERRERHARGA